MISHFDHILEGVDTYPIGFAARQEYRITYDLLCKLADKAERNPTLFTSTRAADKYWPFYMFKQDDVLDLVQWQGNRWLTGVCGILSQHAANTSDSQGRISKIE